MNVELYLKLKVSLSNRNHSWEGWEGSKLQPVPLQLFPEWESGGGQAGVLEHRVGTRVANHPGIQIALTG